MTNENWGLMPILFHAGGFAVEAYPVFVFFALIIAFIIYRVQLKRDHIQNINSFYIAIFAIIGGMIGSKLPIIIMYWNELNARPGAIETLLSGRTIVGGLIGGTTGTFLAKKIFGIKERLGNQIALPVAAGMAIGRLGCLFRGCCYGRPTNLLWGIDLGDHIARHPTQIYEILFDIALISFLGWKKKKEVQPGELFKIFLNCYLSFRFLLEFIRVEKIILLGLTDFQLLCAISLVYINRCILFQIFSRGSVSRT